MQKVSVSCDRGVLKPNCAEIATFIKTAKLKKESDRKYLS